VIGRYDQDDLVVQQSLQPQPRPPQVGTDDPDVGFAGEQPLDHGRRIRDGHLHAHLRVLAPKGGQEPGQEILARDGARRQR